MNKVSFRCLECNNILIPQPMTGELECRKCGAVFKRNKDGELSTPVMNEDQMKTELRAMQHENPLLRAQMEAEEKAKAHKEAEHELLETRMGVNEIKQVVYQKKKEYTVYIILIGFFSVAFAVVFGSHFLHYSLSAAVLITAVSTFSLIKSYQKFKKISSHKLKELNSKVKGLEFATYGDMNHE